MASFKELQQEILTLKAEKKALILAHYYVPLEVQDIADHVCDSFVMAKLAKAAEEDLIVICGVRFMGESAKILSPDKTVLLPVPDAGCPMADMVTPEAVQALREAHPDAEVVCYVNSSAATKAVSDICCTSSSALAVANASKAKEIIFVPDQNLGSFVAKAMPDKTFVLHPGFCPVHNTVSEAMVLEAKSAHPDAVFAVHPECKAEVLRHADFIGSTAEIIAFARKTDAKNLIIGTEVGVVERLRRELPEKGIFCVTEHFVCDNMKKITLEAVRDCLRYAQYPVELSAEALNQAKDSLDRMVQI